MPTPASSLNSTLISLAASRTSNHIRFVWKIYFDLSREKLHCIKCRTMSKLQPSSRCWIMSILISHAASRTSNHIRFALSIYFVCFCIEHFFTFCQSVILENSKALLHQV
jgi:hypothetical protein